MFFIMMLATFLARVNPPSTMAKPACMRNTRMPATMVQTVSTATCHSGTGLPSRAYAMAGNNSNERPTGAQIRNRLSMVSSSCLPAFPGLRK